MSFPIQSSEPPAPGKTISPGQAAASQQSGARLEMWLAPEVERQVGTASTSTVDWPARNDSTIGAPMLTDFGPYELLEEIGRGGMGVVYRARQKGLDRIVAIKMILASHLASAEQIDRFYAEARAAARLQDARVVSIHDVGQIRGQHYFAMEYVAGPSLAQLVRSGPLPVRTAAQYVLDVARAVGRLHRQGVVHRDLKPSNILLDKDGQPCVTDFGLAKMLSSDRPDTRSGAIVGTPSYMAPEQASGRRGHVGPLSDVYSLGAILYELVSGRPPFEAESPLDTLVQVIEGEAAPLHRYRPDVPRSLEQICMRCLEKDPSQRYASAIDLADDLDRYLRGEPVEARRLTLWQRARRWARREPALVSRVATLGLCALFTQFDRFVLQRSEPPLSNRILIVIVLGILASLLFQTLLKSPRWAALGRIAWSTADMILFSSLMVFSDGTASALVAGYFLLVATSGLWFRERMVWYTTALAAMSYVLISMVDRPGSHGTRPLVEGSLVLLGLVAAGFVVAYQVKRVRALSSYYEHRPLP
jgi:serine/threonine-protein kinase